MSKVKLLLDVVEDMRNLADSIQAVADAMLQNEPTAEVANTPTVETPTPKEKPLTIDQVRSVLRPKIKEKGKDAVQGLLKKYGSPLLSEIDPSLYAALVADAEVL